MIPKYTVLDKDTINSVIMLYLSSVKKIYIQIKSYGYCKCHSLQVQERMPLPTAPHKLFN